MNPLDPTTREELPSFIDSVLAVLPDLWVVPTRWAETVDGSVLIEWVNTGTLNG